MGNFLIHTKFLMNGYHELLPSTLYLNCKGFPAFTGYVVTTFYISIYLLLADCSDTGLTGCHKDYNTNKSSLTVSTCGF